MMPDHIHQRYVAHYQQEQRRKADLFRLALIAQQDQPRIRFYYPLMQRLGGWLVAYGTRLQTRYGALKQAASASLERTPQAAPFHSR
jgi:hypothetical protein